MAKQEAVITETYSRRMRLRLADDRCVDGRVKGRRLKPVCGDRVVAEPIPGEPDWLITDIHARESALTRPNRRGQVEVLAANVELLVVVAAAAPSPDWFVVDRYLCAAENMGIAAAVAFNKTDLGIPAAELADYATLGYATAACSARDGTGIDAVAGIIRGRMAIVVGQSGVGKSSIVNALLGSDHRPTSALSGKTQEGRHTTVNSVMLQLPNGGAVIDSPGVRDYAPVLRTEYEVAGGFREVAAAAAECRFANCRHLREPDCAVKAAVARGDIDARRYASYKRSLNTLSGRPC